MVNKFDPSTFLSFLQDETIGNDRLMMHTIRETVFEINYYNFLFLRIKKT